MPVVSSDPTKNSGSNSSSVPIALLAYLDALTSANRIVKPLLRLEILLLHRRPIDVSRLTCTLELRRFEQQLAGA
jgi:hypothetical protein